MKAKLQHYLQKTFGFRLPYPENNINCVYSIGGQAHIRFDLGGELLNGTSARVERATQRAVTLFEETFENREEEIWVLAYKYPVEMLFGRTGKFLQKQFSVPLYTGFYKKRELVYISNKEALKTEIIIGKVKRKNLKYKSILNAIANTEMGFEPRMEETIFFIGTKTSRIFHMYDDRGCLVISNNADNIRDLYLKRIDWIVDHHRAEISKQF